MVEPYNNVEKFLAKIAGEDVDIPAPTNGLEAQLKKIAEKEPSPGGGGVFKVTFTGDIYSEENNGIICNKTFDEIKAGFDAGNFVYGVLVNSFEGTDYFYGYLFPRADDDELVFDSSMCFDLYDRTAPPTPIGLRSFHISIHKTNGLSWTVYSYQFS